KNPGLRKAHIPADLRPLFEEVRNPSSSAENEDDVPDYFKDEKTQAPTLEKEAAALRSVDSFGLKVIRHTLLGLQSKEDLDLQNILSDLDSESSQHLLHNLSDGKKKKFP
ncbi:hypothetical protein OXX69_013297, partial [Metschnikowia pulcherrima]